jgi:hypothetical protein
MTGVPLLLADVWSGGLKVVAENLSALHDELYPLQLAAMFLVFSLSVNAQTLSGAIDMHAHSDPDGVPRKIDAVDLARLAKERGMRAIVLKNHYEPTQSLAYIVRKDVPGIEVFGGISLDLTVGGVNPAAVEWMTKVRGGEAQVKLTKPS